MNIYIVFIALALCTFLPRYLPLELWSERELPTKVSAILNFVPPAVLTAIFIPSILVPHGTIDFHWSNPYLLGGGATIIIMKLTKHLLLSAALGITTFFMALRFAPML